MMQVTREYGPGKVPQGSYPFLAVTAPLCLPALPRSTRCRWAGGDERLPTDCQKLNPEGKKIHGLQFTGIQEQLLVSQGWWPGRQEEPEKELAFAEVANFQALASDGAAEMCLWRPWPSFQAVMAWGCPEPYPGKTYQPRAMSMFIPIPMSPCFIAFNKGLSCACLHGPAYAIFSLIHDIDATISSLWNEDNNRPHGHQSGSAQLCCSNEHLLDLGGLKWLQSDCKISLKLAKGTGLCYWHCHSRAQINRTTIMWNILVSWQRERESGKSCTDSWKWWTAQLLTFHQPKRVTWPHLTPRVWAIVAWLSAWREKWKYLVNSKRLTYHLLVWFGGFNEFMYIMHLK